MINSIRILGNSLAQRRQDKSKQVFKLKKSNSNNVRTKFVKLNGIKGVTQIEQNWSYQVINNTGTPQILGKFFLNDKTFPFEILPNRGNFDNTKEIHKYELILHSPNGEESFEGDVKINTRRRDRIGPDIIMPNTLNRLVMPYRLAREVTDPRNEGIGFTISSISGDQFVNIELNNLHKLYIENFSKLFFQSKSGFSCNPYAGDFIDDYVPKVRSIKIITGILQDGEGKEYQIGLYRAPDFREKEEEDIHSYRFILRSQNNDTLPLDTQLVAFENGNEINTKTPSNKNRTAIGVRCHFKKNEPKGFCVAVKFPSQDYATAISLNEMYKRDLKRHKIDL
ncbi:MAG: hypothetical protein QNJ31_00735 [Candidatus Caenarcaniphilales bacterium]|nr:hypothetical protein [Candidatus Caenarcaniphilales bacterium]